MQQIPLPNEISVEHLSVQIQSKDDSGLVGNISIPQQINIQPGESSIINVEGIIPQQLYNQINGQNTGNIDINNIVLKNLDVTVGGIKVHIDQVDPAFYSIYVRRVRWLIMKRRINWFGLAAGIITLIVLAVSLFVPWWQLTIGDKLLQVNASPLNTNFGLLDLNFTVPLLWAWNLVSVLIFAAAGVVMLFYSIFPTRSYSKELLGFSYKKPLYILISFIVGLVVMIFIAGAIGFNIPVVGYIKYCIAVTVYAYWLEHKRFGFSRLSIALLSCNSCCRTLHSCSIIPWTSCTTTQ